MRWLTEVKFELRDLDGDIATLYIDILVWLRQLERFTFRLHRSSQTPPSVFAAEGGSNASVYVSVSLDTITVKIDNSQELVAEFKAKFGQ